MKLQEKNKHEHDPCWPQISGNPYKLLIVEESGSVRTNVLLNLIIHEQENDTIFLYVKDLYKSKNQYLVKNQASAGQKHLNDPMAFTEY